MKQAGGNSSYGLVLEGDSLAIATTGRNGFFDPRYLVAALLDHVARADGRICDREGTLMVELVARHFRLPEEAARARLAHALHIYTDTIDLAQVATLLSEILSDDERIETLVMLLEVVAIDGRRGRDEMAAFDEVSEALSCTPEERHAAFERFFAREADGAGDPS